LSRQVLTNWPINAFQDRTFLSISRLSIILNHSVSSVLHNRVAQVESFLVLPSASLQPKESCQHLDRLTHNMDSLRRSLRVEVDSQMQPIGVEVENDDSDRFFVCTLTSYKLVKQAKFR